MNEVISAMLARYQCQSIDSYEKALREIIQEIALLGLWRTKFFEKAAFYGGTSLRILYGLNRFSEDLDFSLLKPDSSFNMIPYCRGIELELKSFGFQVKISKKEKPIESHIESAFIKTGTLQNLVNIDLPNKFIRGVPGNRLIKIKFEIDIDPPSKFETEAKYLLEPIPFSVNTYKAPDLFAGKLHALLFRTWKNRIKGRDWYDFVWFVGREIPVHLSHLEMRMKQTGHLENKEILTEKLLIRLLENKIDEIDIDIAKKDVMYTLKDPTSIEVWSKNFFLNTVSKMKFQN